MKHIIFIGLMLAGFVQLSAIGQTQQQKVKVRTRVTSEMKGGDPIPGAEVKFVGGNRHTSGKDGMFTFAVRGKFEIESATKQGYVMIDPKYLKAFTSYTPDAIPVIMEERSKLNRETERQTQRINKQLTDENNRLMRLNDSLLAAKAITEAKWDSLDQARNNDYLNKVDKVREMAEAFANIDYEMLEEYDRQVYKALSEGNYDEAYRLLKSHKSVEELKKEIDAASAAIDATEQMLAAAKQGRDAKVKKAADQCYRWFEYYKARFMNDSAAYYLEQRALLDTTNVEWLTDCAEQYQVYLGAYDKALHYSEIATRMITDNQSFFAIQNRIGTIHFYMGNLDKALEIFESTLRLQKSSSNQYSKEAAETLDNIGVIYDWKGMFDEAIKKHREAISLLNEPTQSLATAYNNLGVSYDELRNYDSALYYYGKALKLREELLGHDNIETASSYNNIGFVYSMKRDLKTACEYFYKALEIQNKILVKDHPSIANTYCNIGACLNPDKAVEYHIKALAIQEKVLGSFHIKTAYTYNNLGFDYENLSEYSKAIDYYQKALIVFEKKLGRNHKNTATVYNNIGSLYGKEGKYQEAKKYLSEAIAIFTSIVGEGDIATAKSICKLGIIYEQIGDFSKADECYQKALPVYISDLGEESDLTIDLKERISRLKK